MSEKDSELCKLDRTTYAKFKKSVENLHEREEAKVTEKSTITSLKLSNRVTNALYRAQIAFVSDLLKYTAIDLKEIKGIADVGVAEIQATLTNYCFSLKDDQNPSPNYIIYLASKKLKEAQYSNIENLYQLRIIISEALEILEKYAEIK